MPGGGRCSNEATVLSSKRVLRQSLLLSLSLSLSLIVSLFRSLFAGERWNYDDDNDVDDVPLRLRPGNEWLSTIAVSLALSCRSAATPGIISGIR